MTCWQCGAPLPPDAGFCRACGACRASSEHAGKRVDFVARLTSIHSRVTSAIDGGDETHAVAGRRGLRLGTVARPFGRRCTVVDDGRRGRRATGAALALVSLFLTWYQVTLTALGVQFYHRSRSSGLSFPACSRRSRMLGIARAAR